MRTKWIVAIALAVLLLAGSALGVTHKVQYVNTDVAGGYFDEADDASRLRPGIAQAL